MAAWRVLTLLLAELRGLHPREEGGDGAGVPGGVREETGWEYIRPLGQGEGREEEEEVDGEWCHGDNSPETGERREGGSYMLGDKGTQALSPLISQPSFPRVSQGTYSSKVLCNS